MAGIYSRNRACDRERWAGEVALVPFEEFVFIDELLEVPFIESYEAAIESFWPSFIEDSSLI